MTLEKFKNADQRLVNMLIDVIILHPNENILTGRFTKPLDRKEIVKTLLKENNIEYTPNYKQLGKFLKEFNYLTQSAKNDFLVNVCLPKLNPKEINTDQLHYISKEDIIVKNPTFKVVNDFTNENVFINCSQSEPHKMLRILSETSSRKKFGLMENGGFDYELFADVTLRRYNFNLYSILENFINNYYSTDQKMEDFLLPLILLNNDLTDELLDDILCIYKNGNKNIKGDDVQPSDLLNTGTYFNFLVFLYSNFIIKKDKNTYPLFSPEEIIEQHSSHKLGGFSLYDKPINGKRTKDIFGLFNVYILNTFRGLGLSNLIFDKIDKMINDLDITIFTSTKSEIMLKNFKRYNWEQRGRYIPKETSDFFIAEEICFIKGKKDIQSFVFEDKFINKDDFFKLTELPEDINKDDYCIGPKTINDLDYFDLFLNKNVKYIGLVSPETKRIYSIKNYKLFPGLEEVNIDWKLFKYDQDETYFILPDYNGDWLRLNQKLLKVVLRKDWSYRFVKDKMEIVLTTENPDYTKILERVYAKNYNSEYIHVNKKENILTLNLDTDTLFRQDFMFIEDINDWENFKEYIEEFKINPTNHTKFLNEICKYNIDIKGIREILNNELASLNFDIKHLKNIKIDYEYFLNKYQIFIHYSSTSVNFLYVVLYIMYIKEKQGQ